MFPNAQTLHRMSAAASSLLVLGCFTAVLCIFCKFFFFSFNTVFFPSRNVTTSCFSDTAWSITQWRQTGWPREHSSCSGSCPSLALWRCSKVDAQRMSYPNSRCTSCWVLMDTWWTQFSFGREEGCTLRRTRGLNIVTGIWLLYLKIKEKTENSRRNLWLTITFFFYSCFFLWLLLLLGF